MHKNVIVTGANRGIGRATVEKFAREKCNIWACARKSSFEFEEDMALIAQRYGVEIECIYFDLSKQSEIKQAVSDIIKSKRSIDGIINVAGMAQYGAFQFFTIDNIRNVFENNYFGCLYFNQQLIRKITKHTGSILFVSSVAGFGGEKGNIAYGGSKCAIANATRVLASELGSAGIRVNAVAPGMINTDMKDLADEDVWNRLIKQTCLSRVGEAEEVANVLFFLFSEQAAYITGQEIRVDGGFFNG